VPKLRVCSDHFEPLSHTDGERFRCSISNLRSRSPGGTPQSRTSSMQHDVNRPFRSAIFLLASAAELGMHSLVSI
jgi:hypothetical protein